MRLACTLHVAVHWWLGGIRCGLCVFNAFRAVDETAVAFELPSWAEIWIQGLYCRSLVEEMRSAKHMRLLCHFLCCTQQSWRFHALSVNLIEDNCTKIGQREGA
jgi:hypothetical protein